MAPSKKNAAAQSSPSPSITAITTKSTDYATPIKKTSGSAQQSWIDIPSDLLRHYQKNTPQRTRLIDVFMAFLVVVGALQFTYCIVAGNYPFNAFLSGFVITVGQFVLTASLRMQTTEANKSDFPSVSSERAFADYVVGSLILHFFCVNFIN